MTLMDENRARREIRDFVRTVEQLAKAVKLLQKEMKEVKADLVKLRRARQKEIPGD